MFFKTEKGIEIKHMNVLSNASFEKTSVKLNSLVVKHVPAWVRAYPQRTVPGSVFGFTMALYSTKSGVVGFILHGLRRFFF